MSDFIPNYASYTTEELVDVYSRIQKEKYPEKTKIIENLLRDRLSISDEISLDDHSIKLKFSRILSKDKEEQDAFEEKQKVMFRTGNPTLTIKRFEKFGQYDVRMTLGGTVNKTISLFSILFISAMVGWVWFNGQEMNVFPLLILIAAGMFIGLIITFYKEYSSALSPMYAVIEGLVIGYLSAVYENRFPGIVTNSVALTFGVFISLLVLYKTRTIKPTENFRLGVVSATGGICILYFIDLLLNSFGLQTIYMHSAGLWAILINLFIVVIASLNLVLDFDFIENAVEKGAPQYMEWYAAFGLIVTLIWLYLEILRLLSRSRK